MAQKPAVKYIQFHTEGSAARQPELQPRKRPAPRPQKKPVLVLRIQPLALAGILLSAVMLLCMLSGAWELRAAQKARTEMSNLVAHLSWENGILEEKYYEGLDLEQIRRDALALGMIPQEEVIHMALSVEETAAEQEQTLWQELRGLFGKLFSGPRA